jgi:hypothetical protein
MLDASIFTTNRRWAMDLGHDTNPAPNPICTSDTHRTDTLTLKSSAL